MGASAKKTEGLKDIQSTLKGVEKEWRTLFNEETEKLEIESRCRLRMITWCAVMNEVIEKVDD